MSEMLSKLHGPEIFGLVLLLGVTVCGSVVGLVAILVHHWRTLRLAELEAALKQQMLEKGLSPADIEQVLRASREAPAVAEEQAADEEEEQEEEEEEEEEEPEDDDAWATVEAGIVERMVDASMQAEDIAVVLQAFRENPDNAGDKFALIEKMLENDMGAGDIARVLRAMNGPAPARPPEPVPAAAATNDIPQVRV